MIPQEILNQLIEYSSGCIVPSEALEDATFGYSIAQQTIKEKDEEIERLKVLIEKEFKSRMEPLAYGFTETEEIENVENYIEERWQQFAKQNNL